MREEERGRGSHGAVSWSGVHVSDTIVTGTQQTRVDTSAGGMWAELWKNPLRAAHMFCVGYTSHTAGTEWTWTTACWGTSHERGASSTGRESTQDWAPPAPRWLPWKETSGKPELAHQMPAPLPLVITTGPCSFPPLPYAPWPQAMPPRCLPCPPPSAVGGAILSITDHSSSQWYQRS